MDLSRVAIALRDLLDALGEDVACAELATTPARAATSWGELLAGQGQDPVAPLAPLTDGDSFAEQVVAIRDIAFRSVCEHHLLPFDGRVHVMYRSSGPVAGLGAFVRTIEILSSRLQLQERLSRQILDAILEALSPVGIIVVLVARHGCVSDRGPREVNARTVTIASSGCYAGDNEVAAASLLLTPAAP